MSADTFDRLAYGTDCVGATYRHDHALWPGTLGYFLQQMMSPVFSRARSTRAVNGRSTTRSRAAPGGHPGGTTPYALLPTTALQFYATDRGSSPIESEPSPPATIAHSVDSSVSKAPHLGAGNPDQISPRARHGRQSM